MIFDGPLHYPESVVKFTEFRFKPIQELFAYFREVERDIQNDLKRLKRRAGFPVGHENGFRSERQAVEGRKSILEANAALWQVQRSLIWMATNVGPDYRVWAIEDAELNEEKPEQLDLGAIFREIRTDAPGFEQSTNGGPEAKV
jgi:hypothetical protein